MMLYHLDAALLSIRGAHEVSTPPCRNKPPAPGYTSPSSRAAWHKDTTGLSASCSETNNELHRSQPSSEHLDYTLQPSALGKSLQKALSLEDSQMRHKNSWFCNTFPKKSEITIFFEEVDLYVKIMQYLTKQLLE